MRPLATHRTKAVRKEAGRQSFEPLFYQSSRGGEIVDCEKSPKAMFLIPDETERLAVPSNGAAMLRSHQTFKNSMNPLLKLSNCLFIFGAIFVFFIILVAIATA